ncbi:MAG: hypothetical protein AAGA42_08680 [Actinomycetota bacterium]
MPKTVELRISSIVWLATAALLGVVATLIVTSAWSATAAPGDDDSTYVPTPGCRVTDTRASMQVGPRSTPLGQEETMTVQIRGANGQCTGALAIPNDAVGVSLNVTAVEATANSNVRVFPANLSTPPNLSNLNVTPGGPPTPNKVDVQLSPDGKINIFNFRGSVQIVIDINGYYTSSSLLEIDARLNALQTAVETAQGVVASDLNPGDANNISTSEASPTTVATVQVIAPIDGSIAALGTGSAEGGGNAADSASCQISPTGNFSGAAPTGTAGPLLTDASASFAVTDAFDVTAGSTTTLRLVCAADGGGGNVDIVNPALTALFVPST